MALAWAAFLVSAVLYAKASVPDCGISPVKQSRVIGGEDATPGAWPWQVAIYRWGVFHCGGTLISPSFVLTAAHCVQGEENHSVFYVVAGDHDRRSSDGNEQQLLVHSFTVHPHYNPYRRSRDLALIELITPARINERVRPACLPELNQEPAPGTKCFLTGWGKTQHPGTQVNILQQTLLKIVDQKTCNDFNGRVTAVPITNQMLCAGYGPQSPRGGCHGDSGGPLVCQNKDDRWVLHGAVSWGSPRCDTKEAYSVFSKVSAMLPWIEKNANDLTNTTVPPPVCGGKLVATKASHQLLSPNYPDSYPPNSDCTWIIERPKDSKYTTLYLMFMDFSLEEYGCPDYVLVYKDEETEPKRLCGEHGWITFTASNSIRIVFKSNGRHQEKGFNGMYYLR